MSNAMSGMPGLAAMQGLQMDPMLGMSDAIPDKYQARAQGALRQVSGNNDAELKSLGRGLGGIAANEALKGTALEGYGGALVQGASGNYLGAGMSAGQTAMQGMGGAAAEGAGSAAAEGMAGAAAEGAASSASSAMPYIGAAYSASQGKPFAAISGIAGSYFGPVGSVVGSFIGSMLDKSCFITTAVMQASGSDDDKAPELEAMRSLRDDYILGELGDTEIVNTYYRIAPRVVLALSKRPDAQQVYKTLYNEFIRPATFMVAQGNMEEAYRIYLMMIEFVTPFAQEVAPSETAETEMGSLARHSNQRRGALEMMQGAQ